jgi:F-type H+-transporting ATPase subunit b
VINLNITLLIQLSIVLILMFLLNKILFQPVLRILEERRERTEGRKKKAVEVDGQAEAIWADYQKRLQEARAQADRARAELLREGEGERQRIVEAASGEAEKTVTAVKARVRAEALEARKSLEEETGRLASFAAEKLLGRSIA